MSNPILIAVLVVVVLVALVVYLTNKPRAYRLLNNWFLYIDPNNPNQFELYRTSDGEPGGPKHLFRVRMFDVDPYPQPMTEEMSGPAEDGTVGEVHPLVCKTGDDVFVAVDNNQRHVEADPITEAWRKSWDNVGEQPVAVGVVYETVKEDVLGTDYANSARIMGMIRYRLTIATSENGLPELSKGRWMLLPVYMVETFDGLGKGPIGVASVLGLI